MMKWWLVQIFDPVLGKNIYFYHWAESRDTVIHLLVDRGRSPSDVGEIVETEKVFEDSKKIHAAKEFGTPVFTELCLKWLLQDHNTK